MSLGERIRELRKKNNLSQEQLADKLNASRQALQKWETNINEPSIETLKCIACYFEVDIDYLLNGTAPNIPSENTDIKPNDISNPKIGLYYFILILSTLVILLCLIWAILELRSYPFEHENFLVWYLPFTDGDPELIAFHFLNLFSVIGIIYSIRKIFNKRTKKNK